MLAYKACSNASHYQKVTYSLVWSSSALLGCLLTFDNLIIEQKVVCLLLLRVSEFCIFARNTAKLDVLLWCTCFAFCYLECITFWWISIFVYFCYRSKSQFANFITCDSLFHNNHVNNCGKQKWNQLARKLRRLKANKIYRRIFLTYSTLWINWDIEH